jgi:hypothetical protein
MSRDVMFLVATFWSQGLLTFIRQLKKGRLINVTRGRVAGSDVSVARAANLHQATQEGMVDQCHAMSCLLVATFRLQGLLTFIRQLKKGRLINVT